MRKCMVCQHSFNLGPIVECPRCKSKDTTPSLPKSFLDEFDTGVGVKVMHERFEMDEILGLDAFKVGKEWFVNVNTWVGGKRQFSVISVPLSKFRELLDKCAAADRKSKK